MKSGVETMKLGIAVEHTSDAKGRRKCLLMRSAKCRVLIFSSVRSRLPFGVIGWRGSFLTSIGAQTRWQVDGVLRAAAAAQSSLLLLSADAASDSAMAE